MSAGVRRADHGTTVAPHRDPRLPVGAVVAELGRREHGAKLVCDGDIAQRVERTLAPFTRDLSDGAADVGSVLGRERLEEDEPLPTGDRADHSLRSVGLVFQLAASRRIGEQRQLVGYGQRHRLGPARERIEHEPAEERHARARRLGDRQRDDLRTHLAGEVAGGQALLHECAVRRAHRQQVPVERAAGRGRHASHHVEVLFGEVARRRDELE